MSQSNAIFAFVFIGFLFFITARGELRKYMGFLLASPQAPGSPGTFDAKAVSTFVNSTFQTAK